MTEFQLLVLIFLALNSKYTWSFLHRKNVELQQFLHVQVSIAS